MTGIPGDTDLFAENSSIQLRGGQLLLRHDRNTSGLTVQQTIGMVNLMGAASSIVISDSNDEVSAKLVLSGIDRQNHSTVVFGNDGPGGSIGGGGPGDQQIMLKNIPELTNGIIGPWATVEDNGDIDFASYGANGVAALSPENRPAELDGASPTDHVRLMTTAPTPIAADTSIQSLLFVGDTPQDIDVDLGSYKLQIVSGGLLTSRTTFEISNGSITAGDSETSNEFVITTNFNESNIAANVVDSVVPVTLVKSGEGQFRLEGQNTYTGGTVVNQGILRLEEQSVPPNSELTINGGSSVETESGNILRFKTITVNDGFVFHVEPEEVVLKSGGVNNIFGNGTITKLGDNRAFIDGLQDGPNIFRGTVDVQEGILRSLGNRHGTGPTIIHESGVLEFGDESQKFTRDITLQGGAIHSYRGTLARPKAVERRVDVVASSTVFVDGEFDYLHFEQGADLANDVRLTKTGSGVLQISNSLQVSGDASIFVEGGSVELMGRIQSSSADAVIALEGVAEEFFDLNNKVVLSGDNRDLSNDLTIGNLDVEVAHQFGLGKGITTVGPGGTLIISVSEVEGNVVLDGGELIAEGVNQFVGNISSNGEINPGSSPGTLVVSGDFVQQEAGRLVMEIASPLVAEVIYDQQVDSLQVEGELTLDGDLEVVLLHGYRPELGTSFDLLDFNQINGRFANVTLS